MNIHQMNAADALASLHSQAEGLGREEVLRRLREYGRNSVEGPARRPLALRFLGEFTHFFALILWFAAALAAFAHLAAARRGAWPRWRRRSSA